MRLIAALVLCIPLLIGCQAPLMHPRSLLAQGVAYLEEEDYMRADLFLAGAISADTLLDDAWYYRGRSFAEQGESDAADSCFGRAIATNPIHRQALFFRGQLRLRRGELAGAMADFSALTFLYPRLPDGYEGKAWVYDRLGRTEEAIGQLDLAIAHERAEAVLYEERGLDLLAVSEAESAIVDFGRALSIDPSLSRSYAGRAEARYQLGLFSLAIADCDSALALDDGDADAWLTRGRSADESGQFGEAVASYRKFLELVPESDSDVADVRLRLRRLGP